MTSGRPEPAFLQVPDLVGLDFAGARAEALRARVHVADPDPDAPPISGFWWTHPELIVERQEPPAGRWLPRSVSVRVRLRPPSCSPSRRPR